MSWIWIFYDKTYAVSVWTDTVFVAATNLFFLEYKSTSAARKIADWTVTENQKQDFGYFDVVVLKEMSALSIFLSKEAAQEV